VPYPKPFHTKRNPKLSIGKSPFLSCADAYSKTCSPVAVVQFPDGSVKCSEGSAEVLSCEARLQVEVDDCDLSMRFVCKTRSCVPSVIASAIVRMTSAWFAVAVRSSTYPGSWAVAFLRIEQP